MESQPAKKTKVAKEKEKDQKGTVEAHFTEDDRFMTFQVDAEEADDSLCQTEEEKEYESSDLESDSRSESEPGEISEREQNSMEKDGTGENQP